MLPAFSCMGRLDSAGENGLSVATRTSTRSRRFSQIFSPVTPPRRSCLDGILFLRRILFEVGVYSLLGAAHFAMKISPPLPNGTQVMWRPHAYSSNGPGVLDCLAPGKARLRLNFDVGIIPTSLCTLLSLGVNYPPYSTARFAYLTLIRE